MGLLRTLGYTDLHHYRGGLADWQEAGEPVERLEPRPPEAGAPTLTRGPSSRPAHRQWAGAFLDAVDRQSTARLFLAWLAIILLCGMLYSLGNLAGSDGLLANGHPVDASLRGFATALYFSFVTATSVGYGDVVPVGAVRFVAITEAVAGLLVFGAVVAKFVSRRQDEIVREIHRITFEDRLDRVQTSLHLVLSELQAIVAMCDDGTIRRERIASRLESATLVFAGELRAIHDLLYRPQWAPEEAVLGAILAGLAGALRELSELLVCLPTAFDRSPTLVAALGTLARLADEICGECVPHGYAPALREWMDRIQETARRLA